MHQQLQGTAKHLTSVTGVREVSTELSVVLSWPELIRSQLAPSVPLAGVVLAPAN